MSKQSVKLKAELKAAKTLLQSLRLPPQNINTPDQNVSNPTSHNGPKYNLKNILKGVFWTLTGLLSIVNLAWGPFFSVFPEFPHLQLIPLPAIFCVIGYFFIHKTARGKRWYWGWSIMTVAILVISCGIARKKSVHFKREQEAVLGERASIAHIELQGSNTLSDVVAMPDIIAAKVYGLVTGPEVAEFSNKWQEAENEKAHIVDGISARPRTISALQMEYFIKILAEPHNVSKIPIPIYLEATNQESTNFANRFSTMLGAVGYGTIPMDNLFPRDTTFKGDAFYTTRTLPELNQNGVFQTVSSIVTVEKYNPNFISLIDPLRWADLIALYGSDETNNFPSVIIFYPGDSHFIGGELYGYHPTDDPNAVLSGVYQALMHVGVRVARISAKGYLQPGQVAFFVPR